MPITAQPAQPGEQAQPQSGRGPQQDQHDKREELTAKIRRLHQEGKIPTTTAAVPVRSSTDALWRLQLVRRLKSGPVVLLEMHERLVLRGAAAGTAGNRPRKPFTGCSDGSTGTVWSTMSNGHVELQEAGYGHLSRAWLAAACEVVAASAEHDELVRPEQVPAALLSMAARQRSSILLPSPAGGPSSVMIAQPAGRNPSRGQGMKDRALAAQILLGMAELDWSQVPVLMHIGPGPGEGHVVDIEPDKEPVAVLESTADWARAMAQLARAGTQEHPAGQAGGATAGRGSAGQAGGATAELTGAHPEQLEQLLEQVRATGRLEGAAQAWDQMATRLEPWAARD